MEYKLKSPYIDTLIYVPFNKTTVLGKFIEPGLLPFMYQKYPDLFEEIKTIEENVIPISDTKQTSNSNSKGKNI